MSELASIFRRYQCDKASHCYDQFYSTLPAPPRMLEAGVYKGASLRAWSEWWPSTEIIGLDDGQRLSVREMNALSNQFTIAWTDVTKSGPLGAPADLIIDDASHRPRDQSAVFRNLWPLLAPGGTYVIEDVVLYDRPLTKWFQDRAEHFNADAGADLLRTICDAGVIFTMHDFREQSGKPDSVLLVVRKPNKPRDDRP